MHLNLESHEISYAHNLIHSCYVVRKFVKEYDNTTAVLCANFQSDLSIKLDVMDERG